MSCGQVDVTCLVGMENWDEGDSGRRTSDESVCVFVVCVCVCMSAQCLHGLLLSFMYAELL